MRGALGVTPIDLRHLRRMTSRAGLWQHARGASPNRLFGLCTDDNARALIAMVMHYALLEDQSVLPLIERYLVFLEEAFDPATLWFRNFRSRDGDWLAASDHEDAHGRALWSLAVLLDTGQPRDYVARAEHLFNLGLNRATCFKYPRPWAFAILACDHALHAGADQSLIRGCLLIFARRLHENLRANTHGRWFWFEDRITYANACLPHALARAGVILDDAGMVRDAMTALRWLIQKQIKGDGVLTFVGNEGWMTQSGHRASFDQQPIEAMCLVQAASAVAEIENAAEWQGIVGRCHAWFLGGNDLGLPMIDPATGGCFDGLTPSGVNINQGAESLVGWLVTDLTMFAAKHGTRSLN
jgi:hypothetical protein